MQLKVISDPAMITEPVTVSDIKTYVGYTGTDQDTIISGMITAARMYIEDHCSMSLISKQYQVTFEKGDDDDIEGWYILPITPIVSVDLVTLTTDTSSTILTSDAYSLRGDTQVSILPQLVIHTGNIRDTLAVQFTAGASDPRATLAIKRMVSDMFNRKDDNRDRINPGAFGYDTIRLIEGLKTDYYL